MDTDAAVATIRTHLLRSSSRVAVAESLTGGTISARLAAAEGASEWFAGAVVAYASDIKHRVLGVPPGPVVSEAAARAMADGAARLMDAEVSVAVTGVGGPEEQDGQPPGTVWLGLHVPGRTLTRLFNFSGSPPEVVDRTCEAALTELADQLPGLRAAS